MQASAFTNVKAIRAFTAPRPGSSSAKRARRSALNVMMVSTQSVETARAELKKLIHETNCHPIMVRLAWHDSGTFSKADNTGGAIGSIRFKPELSHGCNNGLSVALTLLEPVKEKVPDMSWADLIQLSSAMAIMESGGPYIPLKLGRVDATEEGCTPDGRLPNAAAPFPDKAATPAEHLRNVFYRMGLNDQQIVALSGAHTLGRARPSRSGFGKESTKYTENGPGTPGGQSWTVQWLKFDNSYFTDIKEQRDADLLVLPTDAALFEDEGFRPHAEKYAADQAAFFADYVASHLALSELGVTWEEGGPVTLPPENVTSVAA